MIYKVVLTKKAKVFYANADSILAKKLAKSFENLEQNPYSHPNIKALKGGGPIKLDKTRQTFY